MRERFICHSDDCASGNTFHKNATIHERPDGTLLAAWFAGAVGEGNRDQNTYGSRLVPGEDEWEDSERLVGIEGRAIGSPVYFGGPQDELWLTAPVMYGDWLSTSRIFIKRSPDDGETWGDLELLTERSGIYLKNKPLHLAAENRWILPAYSAIEDKPYFFLIKENYPDYPADFPLLVGGDEIVSQSQEGFMGALGMTHPSVVELPDGDVLAYLRPRQGERIYETRSRDRGFTWSQAEQTDIPNPNAGFDIVYTDHGNLVLIDNPTEEKIPNGRNELAVFMSEDEGESWPYQFYLEREQPGEWIDASKWREVEEIGRPEFTYGNVIQADDGTLHFAYEYRRQAIKHVEITEDEIRDRAREEPIVAEIAD